MKTLKPVNQKSLYASFADLYQKLMNDEVDVETADVAGKILAGMNRTFALEIKKAEVTKLLDPDQKITMRNIEIKNFENEPNTGDNK